MSKKITFVNLVGFITCMLGVFLPWGERTLLPIMTNSNQMLGIQLLLGQFTFVGACVAELLHILYTVKNRRYLFTFAIISEIVVIISPLLWTIYPGAMTQSPPYYLYKALYGAYINFVGGMLLLSGTLSSLVRQI